ncbi:MAG: hypothetical protein ACK5V5_00550 [Cyclobacteriaceae bacterium]
MKKGKVGKIEQGGNHSRWFELPNCKLPIQNFFKNGKRQGAIG